jgi:hypothetical protein
MIFCNSDAAVVAPLTVSMPPVPLWTIASNEA